MPFSNFRLVVEIPSLDRLIDFLTSGQQSEVDAAASQVSQLTARLKKSGDALAAQEKK